MEKFPQKKYRKIAVLILKIFVTTSSWIYIFFKIKEITEKLEIYTFQTSFFIPKVKITILLFVVIMMIINWLSEAIRWEKLLNDVEKISFVVAIKSVLIGISYSIFTPYRIGEYIGRPSVVSLPLRTAAFLANIIGSISQNIITFSLGFISYVFIITTQKTFLKYTIYSQYLSVIYAIVLIVIISVYFCPKIWIKIAQNLRIKAQFMNHLKFLSQYSTLILLQILLLSLFRYFVFFMQYYLLLIFFGVNISLQNAFLAISLSYVLLFLLPGIPIVELGIRASVSLICLNIFTKNDVAIIFSSTTLWFINLAIPAIIGNFLIWRKN